MRPDSTLLAASVAFTASTIFGSAVASADDLPGEPFGVSAPIGVTHGILAGWGAGVAAPWPLPVTALVAAARAGRPETSNGPGFVVACVGLGCIAGTFMEPITYRPRTWTPSIRAAISMNLLTSVGLVAAGVRHALSHAHEGGLPDGR